MVKLITFLGTGNYQTTVYQWNEEETFSSCYIQTALADLFNVEEAIVLLTKEARDKHWEAFCRQMPCPCIEKNISQDNIEEIFVILNEILLPKEKVIIDITHTFRSIPTVVLPIINYLKLVKLIEVEGIYYGQQLLGDKTPKKGKIVDLSYIMEIEQWTLAAEAFLNYGKAERLITLLEKEISKSFIDESIIKKPVELSKFKSSISSLSNYLASNQLEKLANESERLYSILNNELLHGEANQRVKFLLPLIDSIVEDVKIFKDLGYSVKAQINVARWYIKHFDLASAALITREAIINQVLIQNNYENKLYDRLFREEVSRNIAAYEKESQVRSLYLAVGDIRNSIAHFGMRTENIRASRLKMSLTDLLDEFESLLEKDVWKMDFQEKETDWGEGAKAP